VQLCAHVDDSCTVEVTDMIVESRENGSFTNGCI
jgi:hypothetical protein